MYNLELRGFQNFCKDGLMYEMQHTMQVMATAGTS